MNCDSLANIRNDWSKKGNQPRSSSFHLMPGWWGLLNHYWLFFCGKPNATNNSYLGMMFTTHGWLVVWLPFLFSHILGISSSQLTKSYFSEGWPNHQPDGFFDLGDGFLHRVNPTRTGVFVALATKETPTAAAMATHMETATAIPMAIPMPIHMVPWRLLKHTFAGYGIRFLRKPLENPWKTCMFGPQTNWWALGVIWTLKLQLGLCQMDSVFS